jgi:hypothetical protein
MNDSMVHLHSWARSWTPEPTTTSFWDVIDSYKNPGLWGNLRCNGNGSWIYEGLCMGSLLIIHDGSSMKELSPDICSAAVMIYCTFTGLLCKCTIAKTSTSTGSYQGKTLVVILAQLILHAVVQGQMGLYPVVVVDCDNLGIVHHGNKPWQPLYTTQLQADILKILKRDIANQPFAL